METSFLHKIKVQEDRHPWKHFVIDDFLPGAEFNKVQKELCSITDGYKKRENDVFDLSFMFLPHLPLAKLFLGNEFKNFLEQSTGVSLSIYAKSLVQLRLMTPESPAFEPHVDDQDERSLVCLWYLSPGWNSQNGGELTLLKNPETCPLGPDAKVISPLANRMVFFFSDDSNWHSVNKVYNWNRYSVISEWIVNEVNS